MYVSRPHLLGWAKQAGHVVGGHAEGVSSTSRLQPCDCQLVSSILGQCPVCPMSCNFSEHSWWITPNDFPNALLCKESEAIEVCIVVCPFYRLGPQLRGWSV